MEYNVAIKGDPVSGTALLSTTIQAGMLLRRVLGVSGRRLSQSLVDYFGKKVFGFSDNLDSVNRWFSNMKEAEEEKGLAQLRISPKKIMPLPDPMPSSDETRRKMEAGQIWDLCEKIGHDLYQRLRITRCSSQDPGAQSYSDIIIATSALEVGFDDPEVGAVIHHKRPSRMSSFIQRKGRAGRVRGMRPWTAVILSDYGGDRWAFEHAESLFVPKIDAICLPIVNPYVLKIQLTFFLIDWLGQEVNFGSSFDYLSGPKDSFKSSQEKTLRILDDFIVMGPLWEKFKLNVISLFQKRNFGSAEKISDAGLDGLLWENPRPLLRQVIPTLRRKILANWKYSNPGKDDGVEDDAAATPLPEFLPRATFFDLGSSELILQFDRSHGNNKKDEPMNISKALFEICPGRVSKRFSVTDQERRRGFWLSYSDELLSGTSDSVAVQDLFLESQYIGSFNECNIFQPKKALLAQRPENINDSSYSSWNWEGIFIPEGSSVSDLSIFKGAKWQNIVSSSEAYIHRNYSYIKVIRYAKSCEYSLQVRSSEDAVRGTLSLSSSCEESEGAKQAVGFQEELDGIVIKLNPEHLRCLPNLSEEIISDLKAEYYLEKLLAHPDLSKALNPFLINRVWQTSLAMLTESAITNTLSLKDAQKILKGLRGDKINSIIDQMFQIQNILSSDSDQDARLKQKLVHVWNDESIVRWIESVERCLWEKVDSDWDYWIRKRYASTLAQAFKFAAAAMSDKITEDDFIVDVHFESESEASIYLTELESGGVGQIELALNGIRSNPEMFHQGFLHALSHCSRTELNSNILAVVEKALEAGDLKASFKKTREASGFNQISEAKIILINSLKENGFQATRALVVSLMTKVLKPGSTSASDKVLCALNRKWHEYEKILGVSIDARVFAYLCFSDHMMEIELKQLLQGINVHEEPSAVQLYNVAQQMLFSECKNSCQGCLSFYNRFSPAVSPSRQLALAWINYKKPIVSFEQHRDDWMRNVIDELSKYSQVEIKLPHEFLGEVSAGLFKLFQEEQDVGYMLVPVSLTGIHQEGQYWYIALSLKGVDCE